MQSPLRRVALLLLLAVPTACDSDEPGATDGSDTGDEDTELLTTVTLTFTAPDGTTVTASFEDEDGPGGASGSSDPVTLAAGVEYQLDVAFGNSLETPPEDITAEIREEAEEHQVLFYGGVSGPATLPGDGNIHTYADLESDYGGNAVGEDLPVGLANTLSLSPEPHTFDLKVMLRHVPELNGTPQKTASLAQDFANGDPAGEVDADVTFSVMVE